MTPLVVVIDADRQKTRRLQHRHSYRQVLGQDANAATRRAITETVRAELIGRSCSAGVALTPVASFSAELRASTGVVWIGWCQCQVGGVSLSAGDGVSVGAGSDCRAFVDFRCSRLRN